MDDFKVVYSYTRAQAIADGVLVDVTEQARQSGFKLPVAIGDNLFNGYIVPPDGLEGEGQSLEGRLHDVFEMLKAAAACRWNESRVMFDVIFVMAPRMIQKVLILAVAGPGDNGEPVLTICMPEDE